MHYELEWQRKRDHGDLIRALDAGRGRKPIELKKWVRVCSWRYSDQPLNSYGSTRGEGGRFNYTDFMDNVDSEPFPALYIGQTRTVAEREFHGYDGGKRGELSANDLALLPNRNVSIISLVGHLENYIDLTRTSGLKEFASIIQTYAVSKRVTDLAKSAGRPPRVLVNSVKKLLATLYEKNWRGYVMNHGLPSGSQIFGKLVWEAGYNGIVYRSTKGAGRCIAVFPQNLSDSNTVIRISGDVKKGAIKELNGHNWQEMTKSSE